jgi:V8-like Glu-specific endopeptidase
MKRTLGALGAALLGAAIVVGSAPASTADEVRAADFTGIVALDNCSGSVVRTPSAADSDPALVLSNGHCYTFMGADEVVVNEPANRTFTLLDASGGEAGTLRATQLSYATMKDTDVSLYQLDITYGELASEFGSSALTLADAHPTAGTAFTVVSGYWQETYDCTINGFVHQLKEADWTWTDSIRYDDASTCQTIGGTSGSPLVDGAGKVIGVNNTGNDNGEECTLNNPCEVDEAGNVTVKPGTKYGQETYQMVPCIGAGSVINLDAPGCGLPKPAGLA